MTGADQSWNLPDRLGSPFGIEGVRGKIAAFENFDLFILYRTPSLKCLCLLLRRNVTMTAYRFCVSGNGHCGADSMTIPDYVAAAFLLMMVLAVARWFSQRKFEL
jgi:hypothetical protein